VRRGNRKKRGSSLWTAAAERRLVEMARAEYTMEEMARELSLPMDEIDRRLTELSLNEAVDEDYGLYGRYR